MNSIIVIPARYNSSRFPGKPKAVISGHSMLERTWRIASAVNNIDQVIIATEDKRIVEHAESFGATAVMTSDKCTNGTERVFEVVDSLDNKPDVIINFQGDAVLTPAHVLQSIADILQKNTQVQMATPAVKLTFEQYSQLKESKAHGEPGGTLVTFKKDGDALYFSKSMIPFLREYDENDMPVYRHIGIYGYRREILEKYLSLEPSMFEKSEKLEQLRALENGIPIKVVLVNYENRTHWSVDSPDDVMRAEEIIEKEGELVVW